MRDFPESPEAEKVRFLILKGNFLLAENSILSKQSERYQATMEYYENFINKYPTSKYRKEADSMYKSSNKKLKQQIKLAELTSNKGGHVALNSINLLKKICNHGQLVLDNNKPEYKFETIFAKYGSSIDTKKSNIEFSSKFQLVLCMLAALKKLKLDDKLVIVSNYTQTLQLLSILCKEHNIKYVRLDGSVSSKNRNKMVEELNAPNSLLKVFLLSI